MSLSTTLGGCNTPNCQHCFEYQTDYPMHYAAKIDDTAFFNTYFPYYDLFQQITVFQWEDSYGYTPLDVACMFGNNDFATWCVLSGADYNRINKYGQNAFHIAATYNNVAIAKSLFLLGINPLAVDSNGKNGFQIFKEHGVDFIHEVFKDMLPSVLTDPNPTYLPSGIRPICTVDRPAIKHYREYFSPRVF